MYLCVQYVYVYFCVCFFSVYFYLLYLHLCFSYVYCCCCCCNKEICLSNTCLQHCYNMFAVFLCYRLHETRFKPALSAFEFQLLLYNLTSLKISNAGGLNCKCWFAFLNLSRQTYPMHFHSACSGTYRAFNGWLCVYAVGEINLQNVWHDFSKEHHLQIMPAIRVL